MTIHAIHELKTDSEVFQAIYGGYKTFEIRFNDRDFQVGDELWLKETVYTGKEMKEGKPLKYTGRSYNLNISYILMGPIYGLQEGWVIMS